MSYGNHATLQAHLCSSLFLSSCMLVTSTFILIPTRQCYNFALSSIIYFKEIQRKAIFKKIYPHIYCFQCSLFISGDSHLHFVSFPFNLKNFLWNLLQFRSVEEKFSQFYALKMSLFSLYSRMILFLDIEFQGDIFSLSVL